MSSEAVHVMFRFPVSQTMDGLFPANSDNNMCADTLAPALVSTG